MLGQGITAGLMPLNRIVHPVTDKHGTYWSFTSDIAGGERAIGDYAGFGRYGTPARDSGAGMALSDADKALIKELVDRGEPLPERFRWSLFAEPRETELIWPGKTSEVTTAVLPFQSIEQIDEPRAEADAGAYGTGDLFSAGGRQTSGWTNKLIWGDNKLVLSSLKGGPLRREIENAGGLKAGLH